MYKIEKISASGSGDRLLLKIASENGDSETISISCERYKELGLSKGEISDETHSSIVEASEYEQALIKGMRILGYGGNSKKQLEMKLCHAGISKDVAARVSKELSKRSYLKENDDAVRLSEGLARKGYGRRRIISALRSKGYADEAILRVEEAFEEIDFEKNCICVARMKFKNLKNDRAEVQKAIAKLINLGYNVNEAKKALEAVLSERE